MSTANVMVQSDQSIKFLKEEKHKQNITGVALLAGNIHLTDDNDYWSIK